MQKFRLVVEIDPFEPKGKRQRTRGRIPMRSTGVRDAGVIRDDDDEYLTVVRGESLTRNRAATRILIMAHSL